MCCQRFPMRRFHSTARGGRFREVSRRPDVSMFGWRAFGGAMRRWRALAISSICGHAGRAASVGFMASKPHSPDDQISASADDPAAPELDEKLAAATGAADRVIRDKAKAAFAAHAQRETDHQ